MRHKRIIFFSFALFAFANFAAQAVEIISSQHRDADSFKRISEYMTGEENLGRYAVARSDTSRREGFYVALKLGKGDNASNWKSVRFTHIKAGSQEQHAQELAIQGKLRQRLLVGLTEPEWESKNVFPLAWKIEILDASGAVVNSAQSFLWAYPNAN